MSTIDDGGPANVRPMAVIMDALDRTHRRACGQKGIHYMSIPVDPKRDADVILIDAIDELGRMRDSEAPLRAEVKRLRARIALAREALYATGHFQPHQCDDDIAPRITEMWSAMRDATRPTLTTALAFEAGQEVERLRAAAPIIHTLDVDDLVREVGRKVDAWTHDGSSHHDLKAACAEAIRKTVPEVASAPALPDNADPGDEAQPARSTDEGYGITCSPDGVWMSEDRAAYLKRQDEKDALLERIAELEKALDCMISVVGLTAFKYEAQRAVLQEAVDLATRALGAGGAK